VARPIQIKAAPQGAAQDPKTRQYCAILFQKVYARLRPIGLA
jgi:hypothetical protein